MLKKLKKKKNNKGFTLVELLVVIAIIGILAVVAVPSLFKQVNKAHAADAVSYISAFRTAAISEYASTSTVPNTSDIEQLVEGKPEKAISGNPTIKSGADATANYLVAEFTMTKNEIATLVRTQLGSDVTVSGETGAKVTVKLIKLDTTV